MMDRKLIVFFMLVTDKDVLIADYSIKSYGKIYNNKALPADHFTLFIYSNSLSDQNKETFYRKWKEYPYVEIFDNTEKVKSEKFTKLEAVRSPEGIEGIREQEGEHHDEVWSTELQKFSTPYYATVDADFEILQSDFYFQMIKELESDPNIIAYSSDYSPTREIFETYTGTRMILSERWHTWFCIYKEKSKLCKTSHYYYYYSLPNGMKFSYDSAAYFQSKLVSEFGYSLKAISNKFKPQFIHYGAFSKNISINASNVSSYRRFAIAATIGISSSAFFHSTLLGKLINKIYRKFSSHVYMKRYQRVDEERMYFT